MYQTIATWNTLPNPEESQSLIVPKITEMTAAGKTDGVAQFNWEGGIVGTPPLVVQRSWTTQPDAQEWKTYIEAGTPSAPDSVVIFTE